MFAAAAAARAGAGVCALERKDRVGRKLLATGNGRCNITNTAAEAARYYGEDPGFAECALKRCPPARVIEIFGRMGLLCAEEYGGRVFPLCNQASAVLDVLRSELKRLNVAVLTDSDVISARGLPPDSGARSAFELRTADGRAFTCKKLIMAAGGRAAPSLGSNGSGFALLRSLGHTITKITPALAQLRVGEPFFGQAGAADSPGPRPPGQNAFVRGLRGLKAYARVAAYAGGVFICGAEGDVLFADYGLSGAAVMDVSRALHNRGDVALSIDFMPAYGEAELNKALTRRREALAHLTLEDFLTGTVGKKLGQALIKAALGGAKLSAPVPSLTDGQIIQIVSAMKACNFAVLGHNGWENAQVTAGGALTREFDPRTMQSRVVKGLYAAGEILDIFGDCGGYNLQWAWASGYAAGLSAAEALKI